MTKTREIRKSDGPEDFLSGESLGTLGLRRNDDDDAAHWARLRHLPRATWKDEALTRTIIHAGQPHSPRGQSALTVRATSSCQTSIRVFNSARLGPARGIMGCNDRAESAARSPPPPKNGREGFLVILKTAGRRRCRAILMSPSGLRLYAALAGLQLPTR